MRHDIYGRNTGELDVRNGPACRTSKDDLFFHLSLIFQGKLVEMAGDKETLLSMGFDPSRVECAS